MNGIHTKLSFSLTGPVHALAVPSVLVPARQDGLWRHTCFELFARVPSGYVEFNLSPSREWAAYAFTDYRENMTEWTVEPSAVRVEQGDYRLSLTAELLLPADVSHVGLSAVIEELDGTKSYWALRHPPGDKPDFHHPDCFAIELPPASGS
jgi:hypothetical protein